MAGVDDTWSSNSTEAFEINLVRPASNGLKTIAAGFQPKFTYPIFGDDEQIFGYQGLKVNLKYHAADMRPHLHISYLKKFRSIGETEPADIPAILKDFLPEVAFQSSREYEKALQQIPGNWSPPGKCIKEYDDLDGKYEVRMGSLADLAVKQVVNRIQILIPLFIEGGTFIGTDDSDSLDRWTIFFLYRKKEIVDSEGRSGGGYAFEFAGYSTVYRFFHYQDPKLAALAAGVQTQPAAQDDMELPSGDFLLNNLPCRSRISQFIILPPFQGKGNASRLYSSIFHHYLHSPYTVEITVEDPNEAFDDLRDLCDLAFLLTIPEFEKLRINTKVEIPKQGPAPRNMVDEASLKALRLKTKIAPRQFDRVVELRLMSTLAESVQPSVEGNTGKLATKEQEHEYKLWKMLVKQRLYRHNREVLGQLERSERIDKLEETLRSVEFEYARLLPMFSRRNKHANPAPKGKRKLVEEDNGEPASKKARVEDA